MRKWVCRKPRPPWEEGEELTGKHCDIVLVGLVEGVVDDALLIRKALKDVYTHLKKGLSLELALKTPREEGTAGLTHPTLDMNWIQPHAALSIVSSCCRRTVPLGSEKLSRRRAGGSSSSDRFIASGCSRRSATYWGPEWSQGVAGTFQLKQKSPPQVPTHLVPTAPAAASVDAAAACPAPGSFESLWRC